MLKNKKQTKTNKQESNIRNKTELSSQGYYHQKCIIYKAHASSASLIKYYLGILQDKFKARNNNQVIWKRVLKQINRTFTVHWKLDR